MKFNHDEIERIEETMTFLKKQIGTAPRLGVVTGSGLDGLANEITNSEIVRFDQIPHFPKTTVEGHPGKLVSGEIERQPISFLQGRIHYYEGYGLSEVVYPVRVLASWGIDNYLITNSAGAVNTRFRPGELMLIDDHINLMGDNPLCGVNQDIWGQRFPDMSSAYDVELREILINTGTDRKIGFHQGIYAAVKGPSFETPAEVRMLSKLGIDAVGMSTVPEVIALRHMGKRVAGISSIANMAAGLENTRLDHRIGVKVAKESIPSLGQLVSGLSAGISSKTINGGFNARS